MPTLTLTGCAPVPLAHYLKALGIFRLIAEADNGDAAATACWRSDQFHISSRFDASALVDFFLHHYQPTPVLAPWNGGSGFYPKDNRTALSALAQSQAARFAGYHDGINAARELLTSLAVKEKPDVEQKALLLMQCRNQLPEAVLDWLDAVFVLGQDGPKFPPLLGTGGNDGRLEFTNNFMQRVTELLNPETGEPSADAERWLKAALFSEAAAGLTTKAPIGQFFPGAAGGANGTSGFDAPSAVNPWDFVLMIEGALLFAAASVKKLESETNGALVYPFCVRQSGVGYASASTADEKDARCEMWLPLWQRPATLPEIRAIFSEGRAQVQGRAARHGVDFARAAVSLGVDRGIAAFQRYGFQVRNGLSYFATPLERVLVHRNARADLLADVDAWHDRLRSKAGDAPAAIATALNRVERSILAFCRDGSPDATQALLIALGQAQQALARSSKWAKANCDPLSGLRAGWLECPDSAEFRLAASLAGMRVRPEKSKDFLWFRQMLEPLDEGSIRGKWLKWDTLQNNNVAWHEGHLTDSLNAILARRIQRVEKAGAAGWPDWSPRYARLDDITTFIEQRTDDTLLADLLWGLSLLDWQAIAHQERSQQHAAAKTQELTAASSPSDDESSTDDEEEDNIPPINWRDETEDRQQAIPSSFYALLKLCFRRQDKDRAAIPLVPAIHQRARMGDGLTASRLAARRLLASGEAPLVRELDVTATTARRTAAALLFPIHPRDIKLLQLTTQHEQALAEAKP